MGMFASQVVASKGLGRPRRLYTQPRGKSLEWQLREKRNAHCSLEAERKEKEKGKE